MHLIYTSLKGFVGKKKILFNTNQIYWKLNLSDTYRRLLYFTAFYTFISYVILIKER